MLRRRATIRTENPSTRADHEQGGEPPSGSRTTITGSRQRPMRSMTPMRFFTRGPSIVPRASGDASRAERVAGCSELASPRPFGPRGLGVRGGAAPGGSGPAEIRQGPRPGLGQPGKRAPESSAPRVRGPEAAFERRGPVPASDVQVVFRPGVRWTPAWSCGGRRSAGLASAAPVARSGLRASDPTARIDVAPRAAHEPFIRSTRLEPGCRVIVGRTAAQGARSS